MRLKFGLGPWGLVANLTRNPNRPGLRYGVMITGPGWVRTWSNKPSDEALERLIRVMEQDAQGHRMSLYLDTDPGPEDIERIAQRGRGRPSLDPQYRNRGVDHRRGISGQPVGD